MGDQSYLINHENYGKNDSVKIIVKSESNNSNIFEWEGTIKNNTKTSILLRVNLGHTRENMKYLKKNIISIEKLLIPIPILKDRKIGGKWVSGCVG